MSDGTHSMYIGIELQAERGGAPSLNIMSHGIGEFPDLIVPVEIKKVEVCLASSEITSCFIGDKLPIVNVKNGALYNGGIYIVIIKGNTKSVAQISLSARRIEREELPQVVGVNRFLLAWINDPSRYKPVPVGELIARIMKKGLEVINHEGFKKLVEGIIHTYKDVYWKTNNLLPDREEIQARLNKFYNADIAELLKAVDREEARAPPNLGFKHVKV